MEDKPKDYYKNLFDSVGAWKWLSFRQWVVLIFNNKRAQRFAKNLEDGMSAMAAYKHSK